jgi:ubiquinone/menaquinone biosynthesis C-methylase UbiE
MKKVEKSLIQSFYERHHLTGKRLQQSFLEKERGALFSKWIGKNKKVLDLGGRDGTLTRYYCNENNVIIGDIDKKALSYAKDNYDVETQIINLNEVLPFPDNSFDYVVMAEVLEHLPYPMITLEEISRVLKKDGQFIGNLPLAYHLKDRIQILRGRKLLISGDPTHLQFLSYQDVKKLLSFFFTIKEIVVLKGGKKKSAMFPKLFARNIAFVCSLNLSSKEI